MAEKAWRPLLDDRRCLLLLLALLLFHLFGESALILAELLNGIGKLFIIQHHLANIVNIRCDDCWGGKCC